MMGTTVVSFVYYFRILQQMFFRTGETEERIRLPLNIKVVMSLCAISIVILGIMPMIGYNFFYEYFPLMKDFFFLGTWYNSENKRCGVSTLRFYFVLTCNVDIRFGKKITM